MNEETLQEVTEVAIIRHPGQGVLLLHSQSRRWHFPDATVRVHESWEQSLRRGVEADTGITDLVIQSVLKIQNFAPGVVHELAQYGVFFLCTTGTSTVRLGARDDQYRWVSSRAELAGVEQFHPLMEELVVQALEASIPAGGCQVRVNYAIVFVSDMKRSVSFYRDVLGLPLKFESPGWSEFSTGDATVALHGAGNHGPGAPEGTLSAGWCRLGLSVPNLDEFHRNMV